MEHPVQQQAPITKHSTVLPCDQAPAVDSCQGQSGGPRQFAGSVSNAVHILARASVFPVVPSPPALVDAHKLHFEPMSTVQSSVSDQNLPGMPRTGCAGLPRSHSSAGSPSNETFLSMEFLLPLALVGLGHIADGTAYEDAMCYLVPPEVVETSTAHARQDWKTMDVNTLLERIVLLKDSAMLRGILPEIPTTEKVRNEALLRFLKRARDDQVKRCIHEHRQLRELENGIGELRRKLGKTYSTCDELVTDDEEDRITFIDDEGTQSYGD